MLSFLDKRAVAEHSQVNLTVVCCVQVTNNIINREPEESCDLPQDKTVLNILNNNL